eukprot:tig00020563_g11245.t1
MARSQSYVQGSAPVSPTRSRGAGGGAGHNSDVELAHAGDREREEEGEGPDRAGGLALARRKVDAHVGRLRAALARRGLAFLEAANLIFLVECQVQCSARPQTNLKGNASSKHSCQGNTLQTNLINKAVSIYELRARIALRKHEDVALAEAIYRDGIFALPRSAYIRIHYSLFIRHYKGDTGAAAQRMRGAAAGPEGASGAIAFDLRYLVFEKQFIAGASLYVTRISEASKAAAAAYEALLRKHAKSKMLLRSYANFARSVENNVDKATLLFLKADEIEEQEARALSGDASAGDGMSEVGDTEATSEAGKQSNTGSGSSEHVKNRVTAKKKEGLENVLNNEGQTKNIGVLAGLAVLAAIVVAFYVASRELLAEISGGLARITDVASQARFIASVTDHARSVHLAAYINSSTVWTQQMGRLKVRADQFRDTHQTLYFGRGGVPPSDDPHVLALWNDQAIEYAKYLPGGPGQKPTVITQKTGLFDLGNMFYSLAAEFQASTFAQTLKAAEMESFRFIQVPLACPPLTPPPPPPPSPPIRNDFIPPISHGSHPPSSSANPHP